MRIGTALILVAAATFLEILASAGAAPEVLITSFDKQGTITDVLTPSRIIIGTDKVDLADVDPSGLDMAHYMFMMQDLKDYFIGKDVLVKGNYVYFDLDGEYNINSINGEIQKEINDALEDQYYDQQYYDQCRQG